MAKTNDKSTKTAKDVKVAIRAPADLVTAFERVARDAERSVSAEIRLLMRQRIAEKGVAA